jgi:hypothetical protein
MPNQRAEGLKRTTITVDADLYLWAMAEAKRRGINNFSTFVRVLIATERRRTASKTNEKNCSNM